MWIFSYWLLPVLSACMWLAMLLGLLLKWVVIGSPHYPGMKGGQTIPFISDIGATGLKPLFIAGSAVTAVSFNLAFIAERWLRHIGRLAPNKSWTDKAFAITSIIFAILGGAGLILLAVFDSAHHNRLHHGFLVMFMGGYLLSAIFVCAEYQRLGSYYRQFRILAISFWVKLFFIGVEIALAVAFGVLAKRTNKPNIAAVLEWVISLIFTFYILSFVIDLLPSTRVPRGGALAQEQAEMGMANGGPVFYSSDARQHEGVPDQAPGASVAAEEDERFYRGQIIGGGNTAASKYPRSYQ